MTDRTRILHLLPDLEMGGGQTIVLNHLREADRRRFDVLVATLRTGGGLTEQFAACTAGPLIHLGHTERTRLAVIPRLAALLRRERIDILHVHTDDDRKLGHVAALFARVKVVGHLHSEWVHLGPMSPSKATRVAVARARFAGWIRDRAEALAVVHYIAESARVRSIFRPLVHQPIAVLDQAIPAGAFTRTPQRRDSTRTCLGLASDTPVLVCVSRLVEGKGQESILESVARLCPRHPGVVLLLVGDGPKRDPLQARARHLGVEEQCRFLGSRLDIPDLLAAADVFVFASENEGFGLVVLEAMAAALPVVAFRLPALEEFVDEGTTGWLIDDRDVEELAATVDALLTDPQLARAAGAAGREVVTNRFHAGAVARSFERVYEEVMDRSAPSSHAVAGSRRDG